MTAGRAASIAILATLLLIVVAFALTWRPAIGPSEPQPRSSFDPALIAKGAQLAAIGDCNACHTAPNGKTYAGGRALQTPFGTIYGTNITPDPYTGIGNWSEEAFVRAMQRGIDRAGRHLYPAFPYEHFTQVAGDDLRALYAYVMTREPVRAETPANRLPFPFNIRPLLAGWKLLYLDHAAFRPDSEQTTEWNRGAYLVQGLAHCGACHTPRTTLGAENQRNRFDGGEIEGWHAPALNASSPAPAPWSAERLYNYLRTGSDPAHGTTSGPMVPVVHNLSGAPEEDVRAIATYVASFTLQVPAERQKKGEALVAHTQADAMTAPAARQPANGVQDRGASTYAGACAVCHEVPRDPTYSGAALDLRLSSAVSAPTPRNFLNFVLLGVAPGAGERGRWMPGFAGVFTDEQLVTLANYVRQTYGGGGQPWQHVGDEVSKARRSAAKSYAQR